MRAHIRSARFAVALALLGMALNALWPLLANAALHTEFFAAEICAVNSGKSVGAAGKPPLQLPVQKHQNMQCMFCASGVCNASLTGVHCSAVAPSTATQPGPHTTDSRPTSNNAFLFAESRAPPVSSLL